MSVGSTQCSFIKVDSCSLMKVGLLRHNKYQGVGISDLVPFLKAQYSDDWKNTKGKSKAFN